MLIQNTFSTASHLTGWKQIENIECEFVNKDVMVIILTSTDKERLKIHLSELDMKKGLKFFIKNLWKKTD